MDASGRIKGRESSNEDYDEALRAINELEEVVRSGSDLGRADSIIKTVSSLGPSFFRVEFMDAVNAIFPFTKAYRGNTLNAELDALRSEIPRAKERLEFLRQKGKSHGEREKA